jgi:hypothetical protein
MPVDRPRNGEAFLGQDLGYEASDLYIVFDNQD